jgi:hypothetical protein
MVSALEKHEKLLLCFAFKFKLRHYISGKYFCLGGHAGKKWEVSATAEEMTLMETPKRLKVGRYRLPLSTPELKARLVSALETKK